jgi:hypothetical protein
VATSSELRFGLSALDGSKPSCHTTAGASIDNEKYGEMPMPSWRSTIARSSMMPSPSSVSDNTRSPSQTSTTGSLL